MQEIFCSMCSYPADMAMVDGVTYTICGNCGTIHVAETEQYVSFDATAASTLAVVPRKLLTVALAMMVIDKNADDIYREIQKKFDMQ